MSAAVGIARQHHPMSRDAAPRPPTMHQQLGVKVSKELHEAVMRAAAAQNLTAASFVRRTLEEAVR